MFGSIVPTGFRALDPILSWWGSRPGWYIKYTEYIYALNIKTQRIFIVAIQHSNMAIIWQLYALNALSLFCCLLAGAPPSAASLTFSQHHIAVLLLCVWAGYLMPPEQKQTPQTKKPTQQTPSPWGPETPSLALHSQVKAHTMELLLHLESSRDFAWCFVFICDSFITGRKMNICICSTWHDTYGVVTKDKSCIRTDKAADQAIPPSCPAASLLPLSFLL